jgi:pantoate--beta-alanine ligase
MGWQEQLQLHFCTTLREQDGLAMSSRNMRLNSTERAIAPIIYNTLLFIKNNITIGSVTAILQKAKNDLLANGLPPEYVDLADAITLEPIHYWDGEQKIVCLIAAFLNEVRLIDNMVLN